MKTVMQEMLETEAAKGSRFGKDWTHAKYDENENPHAINGDEWLDKGTSYVWRVGVLLLIDANKADWFEAHFGMLKDNQSWRKPEYLGCLKFPDGEADDPARVMKRAFDMLGWMHPSFDLEDEEDAAILDAVNRASAPPTCKHGSAIPHEWMENAWDGPHHMTCEGWSKS